MTNQAKSRRDMQNTIAHIIAQFDSCRISKEGGGKITFEFSADSLAAIQQVQTWHNERPSNFAIAIKPLAE